MIIFSQSKNFLWIELRNDLAAGTPDFQLMTSQSVIDIRRQCPMTHEPEIFRRLDLRDVPLCGGPNRH